MTFRYLDRQIIPRTGRVVGMDLGMYSLAALSNGDSLPYGATPPEMHGFIYRMLDSFNVLALETLDIEEWTTKREKLDELDDFIDVVTGKFHRHGVVFVPRNYPSSKLCAACGYFHEVLMVVERQWVCPQCGAVLHRDKNAAINIQRKALRIMAKQEQGAIR